MPVSRVAFVYSSCRDGCARHCRQCSVQPNRLGADGHGHADGKLPAQHGTGEYVVRVDAHGVVTGRIAGGFVETDDRLYSAGRDRARGGDIGAGTGRYVVVGNRQRPTRRVWSGGKAAECAGKPEARAAFIGAGGRRQDDCASRKRHGRSRQSQRRERSRDCRLPCLPRPALPDAAFGMSTSAAARSPVIKNVRWWHAIVIVA